MRMSLTGQFIELCILLGCDYLEPCKGIGPKTALKLLREHGGLGGVVDFVRGKMAAKAEDNAAAIASQADEATSEPESDGEDAEYAAGGGRGGGGSSVGGFGSEGEDELDEPRSPPPAKKKVPSAPSTPKKKKVTSAGMQIPEYWPWEEAKKIFLNPDVVKGKDLEVEWKSPDVDGLVEFLCRDKGFKWVFFSSIDREIGKWLTRGPTVRTGCALARPSSQKCCLQSSKGAWTGSSRSSPRTGPPQPRVVRQRQAPSGKLTTRAEPRRRARSRRPCRGR